ncbi:MAG: hypothetical protein KKE93_01825 [Nanoarchaeota archaeon]|nr:hypothetical protein [Nanoarchaeota archaeon]
MMKKILFVMFILSLVIFISGCGPGGTGISPGGIPVAYSDETYTTTIAANSTCKLVGATSIGGTLSLSDNCVISGTAPHADNTRIIPFKVEITDANAVSNIHEMHLTVQPQPVRLQLPDNIEDGTAGKAYPPYSFCNPKAVTQCGGAGTINPSGGNPPYSFTISGQPMGLSIRLNGVLSGTIPEGATEKDYNIEVCVKDMSGNQDCGNTVLKITSEPKIEGSKWTGKYTNEFTFESGGGAREEAEFSFTVGEYGGFSGTGTGWHRAYSTGICKGEATYNDLVLEVNGGYDKSEEYNKQFWIQIVEEDNYRKYITECSFGSSDASAFPFNPVEAIYLKPEDGATYDGPVTDAFQSHATIEIHRVE